MAKLARVIFRLDFKKTCTSLLNAPGTAFEVLESVEDDFWDKVSETVQKHVFTATYHVQDNIHRQLSVDPQNINGAIERSEEHTSELQSLMRISYAVFCLKKKKTKNNNTVNTIITYTTKHY